MTVDDFILTKKSFGKLIDDMVKDRHITYMESIIEICKVRMIDPSDVGPLINQRIRDKIEAEAIRNNMMKSGGNTLPLD
jgi:hypothetical protein